MLINLFWKGLLAEVKISYNEQPHGQEANTDCDYFCNRQTNSPNVNTMNITKNDGVYVLPEEYVPVDGMDPMEYGPLDKLNVHDLEYGSMDKVSGQMVTKDGAMVTHFYMQLIFSKLSKY